MKRYEKYKPSGIEWIGEVPEHWELKKIKFCFDVYAGATPKTENPDNWDGDIVWVTPADYKTEDKYIRGGQRTITKQGYDSCNTQIVPKGSIVFSKRAPIGTVAISDVELCTNQGCLSCVPKGTNSTYYYYVMTVSTECFDLLGSGATFKEISADSFSNVKLPFPTPVEQEAIAAYLDARCGDIDKVVATQEKRIALLNEMKQSIITQAVTQGLNPDAKMKDSGVEWIGMVPEHWEVKRIKFTGTFGNGLTYSPNDVCEDGVLVIRSSNIQGGKLTLCDNVFVSEAPNDLMVEIGDVIICSRNGSAALVGKSCYIDKEINATFGAFMMRYKPSINSKYGSYLIQTTIGNYKGLFATTTINQLTKDMLSQMFVPVAPDDEQAAIVEYLDRRCGEIDRQIEAVTRQVELLKEYKQSLITEVVTGKRKVC